MIELESGEKNVVGYIVHFEEDFEKKLKRADQIEGYPEYYSRKIITTYEEETHLPHQCFVYYTERFDKGNWIESGDYLKRNHK